MRLVLAACILVTVQSCVTAPLPPAHSVLLDGSHAEAMTQQCSRPSPGKIDGTWTPDVTVLSALDSRLHRVTRLRAACCFLGYRMRDVSESYVQYVGIILNGRKYIYVNGFRGDPPSYWRDRPVHACDGGTYFWGVVYDPVTGALSDFAVNGSA